MAFLAFYVFESVKMDLNRFFVFLVLSSTSKFKLFKFSTIGYGPFQKEVKSLVSPILSVGLNTSISSRTL